MNMQVIIDPVDGFSLLAGGQCPLPPATAGGYRVYVSIATQLRASRTGSARSQIALWRNG